MTSQTCSCRAGREFCRNIFAESLSEFIFECFGDRHAVFGLRFKRWPDKYLIAINTKISGLDRRLDLYLRLVKIFSVQRVVKLKPPETVGVANLNFFVIAAGGFGQF